MDAQEVRPLVQESLPPEISTMTLEEFLESDLEGYEYIKGELVPMAPTSLEHGDISMNLISLLNTYVRENQLGVYISIQTQVSRLDERVLIPDIAFLSTLTFQLTLAKHPQFRQTLPLK